MARKSRKSRSRNVRSEVGTFFGIGGEVLELAIPYSEGMLDGEPLLDREWLYGTLDPHCRSVEFIPTVNEDLSNGPGLYIDGDYKLRYGQHQWVPNLHATMIHFYAVAERQDYRFGTLVQTNGRWTRKEETDLSVLLTNHILYGNAWGRSITDEFFADARAFWEFSMLRLNEGLPLARL